MPHLDEKYTIEHLKADLWEYLEDTLMKHGEKALELKEKKEGRPDKDQEIEEDNGPDQNEIN